MPTPYRVATADDLPALTEVMATAFFPDPVWGPYSFPDAAARPAQSRAFWQANVAATLRFPWTIVTPACEAAAVWVPPGEPEMTPEQERGVALLMAGVLGSEQAEVVMAVFDQLDAAHPHDVDHYYLSLLGTHDDHRGKGLGMGVLAASLELIDAVHQPAYLESTNPANNPRYQSVGFAPHGTVTLPNGHVITTMWRPAR